VAGTPADAQKFQQLASRFCEVRILQPTQS